MHVNSCQSFLRCNKLYPDRRDSLERSLFATFRVNVLFSALA